MSLFPFPLALANLCVIFLPKVFDVLRGVDNNSIIVVISPLIALMEDQVASITSLGISAVHVSDDRPLRFHNKVWHST